MATKTTQKQKRRVPSPASAGWANCTFFRCCPVTSSKASVEACEDGEAVAMPCAMCGAPVLVCMNQQLAIAKNPAIKVLGYGCADKLRFGGAGAVGNSPNHTLGDTGSRNEHRKKDDSNG